jgi:hypothetical protein
MRISRCVPTSGAIENWATMAADVFLVLPARSGFTERPRIKRSLDSQTLVSHATPGLGNIYREIYDYNSSHHCLSLNTCPPIS